MVPEVPDPAPAEGQIHHQCHHGRRAVVSRQLHPCPVAVGHVCLNGITRYAYLACRYKLVTVPHIIEVDTQSCRGVPEGVPSLEIDQPFAVRCG